MTTTRGEWAQALLTTAGWPSTQPNLTAIVAWETAEGTRAKNNPLATTMDRPGATNFNAVGVKNYPDFTGGIDATLKTLASHRYDAIRAALSEGVSSDRVARAVAGSAWGTGAAIVAILPAVQKSYSTYANKLINSTGDSGAVTVQGPNLGDVGNVAAGEVVGGVAGAVAGALGWIDPVAGIKDVGSAAVAVAKVVVHFAAWAATPKNWLRLAMIVGGAVLVIVGLRILTADALHDIPMPSVLKGGGGAETMEVAAAA